MFKIFLIILLNFSLLITAKISYSTVDLNLTYTQRSNLEIIKKAVNEFNNIKKWPEYFYQTLNELNVPHYFRENLQFADIRVVNDIPEFYKLDKDVFCDLCYTFGQFMFSQIRNGLKKEKLIDAMTEVCISLNIENERVCRGFLELNFDIFISIIKNNEQLKGTEPCDLIFQNVCQPINATWMVNIPDGESEPRPKPTGKKTIKIVHVSDFHYDPLYTENKVKTCSEPICCQIDQPDGNKTNGNVCGYYAEYGNDVSEKLIDEVIEFINTMPYDYIYFTGDIVSHRVWSTSQENNTASIDLVFKKLAAFPRTTFPVLGNHEPSPLNVYNFQNSSYANLSTQWLYNLVEDQWNIWLPDTAKETIAKGGYYTVSPMDGWRIIVLNSNVAYVMNWWLLESNEDPYGQLEWLAQTLYEAELNNENVHILSHIPSGNGVVFHKWSEQYYKIINRFANTIKGQFNGHTHMDQFVVYYNESNWNYPINVAWNGASVDTMDYNNPSFKVYTIDAETFDILDIDEWTFNLTLANQYYYKFPEWYKLYSFRNAYNLPDLTPESLNKLVMRMAGNHEILKDYHRYRYRNSDNVERIECDDTCLEHYLCEIVQYLTLDMNKCNQLLRFSKRTRLIGELLQENFEKN